MSRAFLALLLIAGSAMAAVPDASLANLMTPRDADVIGIRSAECLAVDPHGAVVIGGRDVAGGALFDLGSRRARATGIAEPIRSCAFTPDGALLAVIGRSLGYYAGGRFHSQLTLPNDAMQVAAGRDRLYLFGGKDGAPGSLYAVDPNRGFVKLATFPLPISAADARGETLVFSVANEIYRLVAGGELRLICRVPGAAITSLAAVGDDTIFFLAGRTLYCWRPSGVTEVAVDLGDRLARRDRALYVLDSQRRTLVRFDSLDAIMLSQ